MTPEAKTQGGGDDPASTPTRTVSDTADKSDGTRWVYLALGLAGAAALGAVGIWFLIRRRAG